jgi:hypothetical protein
MFTRVFVLGMEREAMSDAPLGSDVMEPLSDPACAEAIAVAKTVDGKRRALQKVITTVNIFFTCPSKGSQT